MQKITIITICFNNLSELIETIQSVDKQKIKPFEHIIIDGSKNNQIEQYLNNNQQAKYRKWICEPDKGISDAYNKGIKNITGDYVQFLNSGDYYFNEKVIETVKEILSKNTNAKWLHGILEMKRGGFWVHIGKPFDPQKVYRGMRGTFHPTMFVHKSLFDKYGGFDSNLKIAVDYDFLVRIRNEAFVFINQPLSIFNPDGISNTSYLASLVENKYCYEKYCGKSIKLVFWQIRLKFLHWLLQSKIGLYLYKIKIMLSLENK